MYPILEKSFLLEFLYLSLDRYSTVMKLPTLIQNTIQDLETQSVRN